MVFEVGKIDPTDPRKGDWRGRIGQTIPNPPSTFFRERQTWVELVDIAIHIRYTVNQTRKEGEKLEDLGTFPRYQKGRIYRLEKFEVDTIASPFYNLTVRVLAIFLAQNLSSKLYKIDLQPDGSLILECLGY